MRYLEHIVYMARTSMWAIEDRIPVPPLIFQVARVLHQERHAFLERVLPQGWQIAEGVDSVPLFIQKRTQEAPHRWFPARAVSVFLIRDVRTSFYPLFLRPEEGSQITLDVPKYLVTRTYPTYTKKQDLLRDNAEQFTIPIKPPWQALEPAPLEIRVEVLGPPFRNELGTTVSEISGWSSLKWVMTILAGVLSDEIKKTVIASIRRVFPALGNFVR